MKSTATFTAILLARSTAFVVLAALAGCQNSVSPMGSTLALLRVQGDGGSGLIVLDVESGNTIERPASGLAFAEDARTLSQDRSTVYFSGPGSLVAFDTRRRAVAWTEQMNRNEPSPFDGLTVYGNYALALSPSEDRILVADSYYSGSWGVAVLDVNTRDAVGFIENLRVRKMFPIQPGPLLPTGGVLALGTRLEKTYDDDTKRRQGKLYLLGGDPLAVQDSIAFLASADSAAGGVREMVLDPTGRYLYFVTVNYKLHKYDLHTRSYAGSLRTPAFGPLVLSPDGSWIYMIDATQTRDSPNSGSVYMVDTGLGALHTIDLKSASFEGLPPQLNALAVTADGSTLYVGGGTAYAGPLYGVQHGSVIAIDTRTRSISQILRLQTWGVRSILML